MLEKNIKNADFSLNTAMLCDAHFHYAVCKKNAPNLKIDWHGCSCAHSFSEWEEQKSAPSDIVKAFGLHPQLCAEPDFNINQYADYLENLLHEGKTVIQAIGEAGFDYYAPEFKEKCELQEEMWNIQLELAEAYKVPLVIHCRRANEKLFEYAPRLKKLNSVLFHSFMGSSVEAESLIKRGINCCFSFGKQMKNGNKKVIDCVQKLPLENLLLETDAPFQTLKGESQTYPHEIETVYKAASEFRNCSVEDIIHPIYSNFSRIFS